MTLFWVVCVVHTRYDHAASEGIRVAVLEFCVGGEEVEEAGNFEVVDVDFFDDESLVVVVRAEGQKGSLFSIIIIIMLIVIDKDQDRR